MEHSPPEIVIDRDGQIPVAAQLTGQIKRAVLGDRLGPGSALPSVRQLSSDLDVDVGTVAEAYQVLARDSVIRPRRSGGPLIDRESKATLLRLAARSRARDVHQALTLPFAINTNGVEALACSRALLDLGGDLIDVVERDESVDLFLGDVAGHGTGASMVMAMLKAAIRMGLRHGTDLTQLLGDLNGVLANTTGPRMFATLACLRIDRAGQLEYALAGHHHITHYRATTGDMRRLNRRDLPIGLFEEATFGTTTVSLDPGDLLAVYTDGLNETVDRFDVELDHERIDRTVTALATRPLEAIQQAVFATVEAHGLQADDRTLLLVRRTS